MKVVILAGGFGTRISEESMYKPKPMIELDGTPILIHLMRYFYHKGFNEFIICGGYKCEYIKEYFWKYNIMNSDFILDNTKNNEIIIKNSFSEKWKVTVVDTGMKTQTAGRIKKIEELVGDEFIMTYGDALSDINFDNLKATHKNNKGLITITSTPTYNKFGVLDLDGEKVNTFAEKSNSKLTWINAGFMIINKEVLKLIKNDLDSFEFDILPKIAEKGQLFTYKHEGFWKCMDTLKDKNEFEELIKEKKTPWMKW